MRGSRSTRQAFPVSLYASLLVALLCLVQPHAARAVQSVCAALQCLPLRVQGLFGGAPVRAAEREAARREADVRVAELSARRAATARVRPPGVDAGWQPAPVAVRERRGPHGEPPSALVLAIRRDAIPGAAAWVTVGDALVGFLDERPVPGPDDPLAGAARVLLLHHRERARAPRRVPARVVVDGGDLDVVIEPAASIDRWPLRCVLPDDPYRAASLEADELAVRTTGLADDPLGPVPRDLAIGTLRIYGYEEPGGEVVPIGLFVEPAIDPGSVHSVVVWTRQGVDTARTGDPLDAGELFAVQPSRLPVPTEVRERWFVTTRALTDAWLRGGAALVSGRRLVGVLDAAGLGYGVVAPFGQPGREWALTLLPDGGGAPVDVVARARERDGELVSLELRDGAPGFARGHAFTGSGGRDLPPGLWIGPAVLQGGHTLWVRHVEPAEGMELAVHLHRPLRAGGVR